MQARLFISSTLLLTSLAKPSYACGHDTAGPMTQTGPQISVSEADGKDVLKLSGPVAQTIFDFLTGPDVKSFDSPGFQVRRGQRIRCTARPLNNAYTCFESIDNTGDVLSHFPLTLEMKNAEDWTIVNFHGPDMEKLFQFIKDVKRVDERNLDTENHYVRMGFGISCTAIESIDTGDLRHYCDQYISRDGVTIGGGTDPVIGSGTHPVVDAGKGDDQ